MANCYFCDNKIDPDEYGIAECFACPKLYELDRSYTVFYSDAQGIKYAHLYMKINNLKYHARLNISNNNTDIIYYDNDDDNYMGKLIITLSDFPINASNINHKLKTILSFV